MRRKKKRHLKKNKPNESNGSSTNKKKIAYIRLLFAVCFVFLLIFSLLSSYFARCLLVKYFSLIHHSRAMHVYTSLFFLSLSLFGMYETERGPM